MIPSEAVEAAAENLSFEMNSEYPPEEWRDIARSTLDAAAAHMLAGLRELVEEMERQPRTELATVPGIAAIIRATLGDLL